MWHVTHIRSSHSHGSGTHALWARLTQTTHCTEFNPQNRWQTEQSAVIQRPHCHVPACSKFGSHSTHNADWHTSTWWGGGRKWSEPPSSFSLFALLITTRQFDESGGAAFPSRSTTSLSLLQSGLRLRSQRQPGTPLPAPRSCDIISCRGPRPLKRVSCY
jgi:hypothetical protein